MFTIEQFIENGLSEIFKTDVSDFHICDSRIHRALEDVFDFVVAMRRIGKKVVVERGEYKITVNGKTFLAFVVKNDITVKKQNIRIIQEQIKNAEELEAVRNEYRKIKREKTIMKIDERLAFEIRQKTRKNGAVKAYEWTQDGWKKDESREYSAEDFFIGMGFSEYFSDFVGQYWEPWSWKIGIFEFDGKEELINEYVIARI